MTEFEVFTKIARLQRDIIVTEKIDGTNAQIYIDEDGGWKAGSRTRWLSHEADNFGFWHWAYDHKDQLLQLGPGRHFGEWWGSGIQRGYGLEKGERRFSLFNTTIWELDRPKCCDVVPVLYHGPFRTEIVEDTLRTLELLGSAASRGFMQPEGVVVYHTAANVMFKQTIDNDELPKGRVAQKPKGHKHDG